MRLRRTLSEHTNELLKLRSREKRYLCEKVLKTRIICVFQTRPCFEINENVIM